MEIDTVKIKRKSDDKKKQKKECFNCGKKEHFARKYFKKTERKVKFNNNRIKI